MSKNLKERGVPIHGVGMQGHRALDEPTEQDLEELIQKFPSLGLDVQITELDVSVYHNEDEARPKKPTDDGVLTEQMIRQRTAQYKMLFDTFRKHYGTITGVTF